MNTQGLSRDEILVAMQETAPPRLRELDYLAIQNLRGLTSQLVEVSGNAAVAEFERFVAVTDRSLNLQDESLRDHLESKKVLVTGGSGTIGSVLLRELVDYNPGEIISISRGVTLPRQTTEGVDYRHVDIRSEDGVKKVVEKVGPDIIFHLAAQRDPSLAEVDANRTIATNIFGTQNVLQAAQIAGTAQIVYASTGKAMRPYTQDIYASSKKVSEALLARTAQSGNLLCSGVRFTHVVDNSIVFNRIQRWIDEDQPIRLHGADLYFYMQSARESAHLLLNAVQEARPGVLEIQTINDLEAPINLTDLALGSLVRRNSDTPIYFCGFESGYEEVPYPGLYDPRFSGELSPLINSFEAPEAKKSEDCPAVDSFPFEVAYSSEVQESLFSLETASIAGRIVALKSINDQLAWNLLDARLAKVPTPTLERMVQRMSRMPNYEQLPPEHIRTTEAVKQALQTR